MQFGQVFSNARRFGAVSAPKISRFGHTATQFLSRAGDIGHQLAVRGGQVVNFIDKTPIGQNPEAAAVLGGARALLRNVDIGSGFASRAAAQGDRALQAYDQRVLPAAQKYLTSNFEKQRGR
jgi:hypothetical protein